ncbi:MAG: hypothetical protein ACKOW1_00910 [Novosphingobium sp.]
MQHDPAILRTLAASARRSSRRPWLALLSALFDLAQGQAELLRHSERNWASATFAGTRHTVALAFSGATAIAAGEELIAALPDHEFAIPGQLVADAAVLSVDQVALPQPCMVVELGLLLLEEA